MTAENCQNLTPKQASLLEALLTSPTVAAAATRAQVSVRSAYRWLNEHPGFRAAYRSGKRAAVEQTVMALAAGAADAAGVLLALANDAGIPAAVRASCAARVVDFVLRDREQEDFSQRLEAIEVRLAELSPAPSTNGRSHALIER